MKMKVVEHRGHDEEYGDRYHPRTLLKPGKDTCYYSGTSHGPPNEDWLIFGVESVPYCITSIGIRNVGGWFDRAIKRISIEGSADNTEYEDWMEIEGIEKGDDDLQSFEVDIASSEYAVINKWKYYKICILDNYGDEEENCFREFVLFGVAQ